MSNPYDRGFAPYEPPTGGPYGEHGAPNPYDAYRSSAPTDGVSIAALICSLTCCAAPVGIGLGIAGIVRTKGGRRSGRWAAITGLVLGSMLTLAMVAFCVFAVVMGSNTVWEDEARVGQCVDIDFLGDLAKARCNEPHDAEVIWVDRFDDALAAEFDDLGIEAFCLTRDLTPEHLQAAKSSDFTIRMSTDAFDEDEPGEDDWVVCYVERTDGDEIDGQIGEG